VFSKLRLSIALVLAAFGMLALAAPAQAAQPVSTTVSAAKADNTLRAVLQQATRTPVPQLARAAAEVCTSYSPGVNVIEVATGNVVYTQHLNIQYCYDGLVVTRLTGPTFTDVLILDPRISILQRLPVSVNGPTPTTLLDSFGPVNISFVQASGVPFNAQVFVRAVVDGLGRVAAVSGIR
jgi:hypothetical protein